VVKLSTGISKTAQVYDPKHPGLNGFLFDIDDSDQVTFESDITDHYVEDNTAVQDHIALRPIQIMLKRFQGEVVSYANPQNNSNSFPSPNNPPKLAYYYDYVNGSYGTSLNGGSSKPSYNSNVAYVTNLASALSVKSTTFLTQAQTGLYKHQLVQATQQNIQNANNPASLTTNRNFNVKNQMNSETVNINNKPAPPYSGKAFNGPLPGQTKAFNQVEMWWRTRTLLTVETPWRVYKNMAILNMPILQEGDTRFMTNFSITLKQIRKASILVSGFNPANYQSRAQQQGSSMTSSGKTTGKLVIPTNSTPSTPFGTVLNNSFPDSISSTTLTL